MSLPNALERQSTLELLGISDVDNVAQAAADPAEATNRERPVAPERVFPHAAADLFALVAPPADTVDGTIAEPLPINEQTLLPPFLPRGHRMRTHWRVAPHAVRALGAALAAAIGGYVEADPAAREAKWFAFFALPCARLCINKNEHNGRALRRRLAMRGSAAEMVAAAVAEADDEEDIPEEELSPRDIEESRTRRKKPEKCRPEAPIKNRAVREATAKTNAGYPGRGVQILLREAETPSLPSLDPDAAITKLRALHPDGHAPNPLQAPAGQRRIYISGEIVREECDKLAKAKSPGCSGWTEDLLAKALRNPIAGSGGDL
jgi:hypothetical protein